MVHRSASISVKFGKTDIAIDVQAQTPQQRKANERYAKQEAAKRGKPENALKQRQKFKPQISRLWIGKLALRKRRRPLLIFVSGVLVFVLCGGLIFELLRFFL